MNDATSRHHMRSGLQRCPRHFYSKTNNVYLKFTWRQKWCWAVSVSVVSLHVSPSLQHQAQQSTCYILIHRDYITCMKSFSVICWILRFYIVMRNAEFVVLYLSGESPSASGHVDAGKHNWCISCQSFVSSSVNDTESLERSRSSAECFICVLVD